MSQINTGLANVTSGSAFVTSDTNANWAGVVAGNQFTIYGSGVLYTVAATPTFSGGIWHMTLTGLYGGTTATLQNYVIHSSFTPYRGFPYPEQGDTQTAAIIKRFALLADAAITPAVYAMTDGVTINLDASVLTYSQLCSVTLAGNRTLVISNAVDGQMIHLRFRQDGTGSRTITVTNGRATTQVTALTLKSAANSYTYVTLRYVATDVKFDYTSLVN